MIYSKDQETNIRERLELFQQAPSKPEYMESFKSYIFKDILAFFNMVLYTYDPRTEMKNVPFITYPFQDDYILWLKERIAKGDDGLTEKSRDMGVSWMVLGVLYWHWLADTGFGALIGSYIEDLIDDKDNMDTHFERLRYFLRFTPRWLLPEYTDTYMNLTNKTNGNSIVGYAPTEKFSRQGRYKVIWADEFAFWERGRSAWTAMGDATRCRLVSSTPNGKGNKFADLALKSNISKKTLHWSLHPLKTREWYESEAARRTPEEVAQELDINYNKSVIGRVYPEFCERNYADKQEYSPTQPLYCAWDFGLDCTCIIWLQVDPRDYTVRVIDYYSNQNKTADFYAPFITGVMKSIHGVPGYQYDDREYIMIQKHGKWQPAIHYGDPTGNNRDRARGTSWIADLKKEGIVVNYNTKEFDFPTRCRKTKLLIRRLLVDEDLTEFIDAMENARYPERGENSQSTTPIHLPIHDWTSHPRTALEYYAVNERVRDSNKQTSTVLGSKASSFETKLKELERTNRIHKSSSPSYKTAC